MKRNTATTLGQLRIGDRFFFLSDKGEPVVREVTAFRADGVKYNKIKTGKGVHAWFWDRKQPAIREVVFIRHTNLLPGDECFMHELNNGDVFLKPGTDKEMRMVDNSGNQVKVRYVGMAQHLQTSALTTGIFVRRASLKTTATNGVQ